MKSLLGRVRTTLGREQIILVSIADANVVNGKACLYQYGYVKPAESAFFPPAGISLGEYLVL